MSADEHEADYRLTTVPPLNDAELIAVVTALVRLGELPGPGAERRAAMRQPSSPAGRRRLAHFADVWAVTPS